MNSISIEELIRHLKLEIIYKPDDVRIKINKSEITRPGLQLAGYLDHFVYDRIQVIGKAEWYYLKTLSKEERKLRLDNFFKKAIPALIIARDLEVPDEMLESAREYNKIILRTNMPTTKFINKLGNYLSDMLAPCTTIHGVLVEVYGIGILILGKSGVGKSEAALELIKRGHRLVADDAVEIKNIEEGILKGMAPEIIRHFLEIRGVGILDIKRLYGVGSVRGSKHIELVVQLESWDECKGYDRVGLDEEYMTILNTRISKVTIPVKPGRNLAMIIEVAAKNYRQKQMGYNAAVELNKKLKQHMGIYDFEED